MRGRSSRNVSQTTRSLLPGNAPGRRPNFEGGGAAAPARVRYARPPMPVRTFRHSAASSARPDDAWKVMQKASTWESVAGVDHVTDPRHRDDGTLAGFRFRARAAGRDFPGVASTTVADPGARMVVTIETSELDGMIDVRLSPEPDGSDVAVELTIRSTSMMAGLFFSTIARVVDQGLEGQVREFARRLGD